MHIDRAVPQESSAVPGLDALGGGGGSLCGLSLPRIRARPPGARNQVPCTKASPNGSHKRRKAAQETQRLQF